MTLSSFVKYCKTKIVRTLISQILDFMDSIQWPPFPHTHMHTTVIAVIQNDWCCTNLLLLIIITALLLLYYYFFTSM
jgi:hypothetical protein